MSKRCFWLTLGAVLPLAGCGPLPVVYTSGSAGAPAMTVTEARQAATECIERIPTHWRPSGWSIGPAENVRFRPTHLSYTQHRKVWLGIEDDMVRILAYDRPGEFRVLRDGDRFRADIPDLGFRSKYDNYRTDLSWPDEAEARRFVDAMEVLRRSALAEREQARRAELAGEREFLDRAAAWRALEKKPALPEEARRFRVLAEDAVRGEKLPEALDYFEKGLAACPLWPEGHYNCAVLCGQLGRFERALWHARRYLGFFPDDRALKDRMYVWEEKLAAEKAREERAASANVSAAESDRYLQLERQAVEQESGRGK
ncbi:MAG TPA: hypothetical protein PK280_14670 [Planctomycetota bacterium]|nr:hypothetical protein [Planctomycetota bacterium]